MNPADLLLRTTLRSMATPVLDSTKPVFDAAAAARAGGSYVEQDIRLKAVSAVHSWLETDDLESGEGFSDRLIAMMVGIADADKNGELDADEQTVVQIAVGAAWDYMAGKGVSEDDLGAVFNDDDPDAANAAADRVREFLAGALPDGEDAAMDDIDNFAFDAEALEPALDAVYKAKFAIRHGRKVRIMKRISGTVRLSAKQKLAVRKMLQKSHSAVAQMRRMKSATIGRRMGLHKG